MLNSAIRLIHYGSDHFDPEKFDSVKNCEKRMAAKKPSGGLWTCLINEPFGWRDWCLSENFFLDSLETFFIVDFTGELLVIDDLHDMSKLHLHQSEIYKDLPFFNLAPDFEQLKKEYDAIYLTTRGEKLTRLTEPNLYGWDCGCVLVLNPDCLKPVDKMELLDE